MVQDDGLIRRIMKLPDRRRLQFRPLMEEYVVACQMSRGPVPDRCVAWERNAVKLRNRLEDGIAQKDESPTVSKNL